MRYEILGKLNSSSDVKALTNSEVEKLCNEIRHFLIDKVGQRGGHLASNLGAVELSVALHRVFDTPKDHIIFDVGHQSYIHKILTGRRDMFDTLRTPGGLSGFTTRRESEHDAFGSGHSSTSISAALGFAESDKLLGKDDYTVAVVGDGAFTGGLIHEAMNNCKKDLKLVVVLNENGMSISSNNGAFASYLSNFRTSKRYIAAKNTAKSILNRIPLLGKPIAYCMSGAKNLIKRVVYKTNYFEDLGFYYIGVIDGHDTFKVERALRKAKELNKCVFVHIKTKKGCGYPEAESSPEKFHSIAGADLGNGTFHSVSSDSLIELAKEHSDVVAVTAAMGIGTGLSKFEKNYPDRYFDVGIAEAHALTFSAGLAANGIKPFVAIYSTFLQRAYDNIVHDVALQSLPVKMFIDRAGLAVSDGATHHGIFDVSFLSHIPEVEIIAPSDYASLRNSINYAYSTETPVAIRYPNASESAKITGHFEYINEKLGIKLDFDPSTPPENIFVTYGSIADNVIDAKNILLSRGINVGIILLEKIKPYDKSVAFIKRVISRGTHIVYVEEGIKNGGAAMITRSLLYEAGALYGVKFDIAAIDDDFANPTEPCDLYDYVGLSKEKLVAYFD
jgi:1-deoxy-D-xylulose-5-phosphate synthase